MKRLNNLCQSIIIGRNKGIKMAKRMIFNKIKVKNSFIGFNQKFNKFLELNIFIFFIRFLILAPIFMLQIR
jgi:hypothetical protein